MDDVSSHGVIVVLSRGSLQVLVAPNEGLGLRDVARRLGVLPADEPQSPVGGPDRRRGPGGARTNRTNPARFSEWVRRALHSDFDQRAGADSLILMGTPEITA